MDSTEKLFWIALFLVFFSYIGYGICLYALVKLKKWFFTKEVFAFSELPEVTLVIPAYNELACIADKLNNCRELTYPSEKLKLMFVTEGSNDGTTEYLQSIENIRLVGGSERRGKIVAINEAMQLIDTPIVIFTDANTSLNPDAVQLLVRHYADPRVAAVAGEKRIQAEQTAQAAGAGEGLYWRYESKLKELDSQLNTIVGAAGELFSIRTALFHPVEADTILDDFMISLRMAEQGYRVVYEPEAYAVEKPSFSVGDEIKRKIRICAGGFQSISRLLPLLNPFTHGLLSFQYVGHRVSRWAIAPFCLPVIFFTNLLLYPTSPLYAGLFVLQVAFYFLSFTGYILEHKKLRVKALFIPFYFSMMNYTVYVGLIRFLRGKQSGMWEKVKRAA